MNAVDSASPATAPKVDYATDLFSMLNMDSPNDNGSEAASTDDNAWAGFQCRSSLPFGHLFLHLLLLHASS